jgi:transketolase
MRNAFAGELLTLAHKDSSIVLLTGDLGFGVLDQFQAKLPSQFFNCGVAEQSMMGIAAGMAASGFRPFVYSIGNFPTLRCLEQIRNDVCYMENPVTIVAVGAGFGYGSQGYSHHAIEDISIMRTLPNLEVFLPGDEFEVRMSLELILQSKSPAYLRLGKGGEKALHSDNLPPSRSPIRIGEGTDLMICSVGAIGFEAIEARRQLNLEGISVSLYSVPVLDYESVATLLKNTEGLPILSVEENVLSGGFGSYLLEVSNSMKLNSKIHRLGIQNPTKLGVGSQSYLRQQSKIDVNAIILNARNIVKALK